jgi:hypothetical protein
MSVRPTPPNARELSVRFQAQTEGFTKSEILLALVGTLTGFCLREIPEPRPIEIEALITLGCEIGDTIINTDVPPRLGN